MTRSPGGYRDTLAYLYSLQKLGIKYGLRNIRSLLAACGHPERQFASVHVAGTNGKGSTASFLASILKEAGYSSGLYTSPHLVNFTERIRINGVEIPEARLVQYTREMRGAFERTHATFFEATTCIAFRYFADEGIDVGVIETGLGGRLDATNTLTPMVSVITNVAMDHMEYLGTTLRAIAREKAGIIKSGVPVVTASTAHEVLQVIRSAATRRRSPLYHAREIVDARIEGSRGGCAVVRFRGTGWRIPSVVLGHPGVHQVSNAALAVAALALVGEKQGLKKLNGGAIARGLRKVVHNTGLGGRLQTISHRGVRITMDVAHNADGMHVLADSLCSRQKAYPLAVFGIVRDKDLGGILDELRRMASEVIAVRPTTERARDSREIVKMARERGILAVDGGSVQHGLKLALRRLSHSRLLSRRRLLVAGSHYLVGEAMQFFQEPGNHKNS
jgi:dihydrofolate synthase / folylpolyglutamate synthase